MRQAWGVAAVDTLPPNRGVILPEIAIDPRRSYGQKIVEKIDLQSVRIAESERGGKGRDGVVVHS
jgi:hypothetical protein